MPIALAVRRLQHIVILPLAAFVLAVLLAREIQDARTATLAQPEFATEMRVTARVNQYISIGVFGTLDGADVIGPFRVPLWRWGDFAVGSTHFVLPTRQADRPYMLRDRYRRFSTSGEIFGLRPSQALVNYLVLTFLLVVYAVYSYVNLLAWDRELAGHGGDPAAAMAALVPRLRAFARRWPRLYLARLICLGLIGYLFVPLLIFGLGGLMTAFVYVAVFVPELRGGTYLAVGIPAFILSVYIVGSLWVRLPRPEAIWVTRRESPDLFALIDSVHKKLGGPNIHRVGIDFRFDAGISQVPRLGLYFWRRNYLILGLPLLTGLPADEVRAVIAHEYGHLVGQHGRLSSWIYQLNRTWNQIRLMLDQRRHWSNALLRNFLDHFQPYFAACSFVHDRDNELFADAQAARLVGTDRMARALIRTEVEAYTFERHFWPRLFREALSQDTPPATPCARLRHFFIEARDADEMETALQTALSRETDYLDTHPCLTDRLRALGVDPTLPAPTAEPATSLLGSAQTKIEREFDTRWEADGKTRWLAYRKQIAAQRARLQALEREEDERKLTETEEIERAAILEELEGTEAALSQYREILDRFPQNALAAFFVGRDLLNRGRPEGLDLLAIAAKEDECAQAACSGAISWLEANGEAERLPWFQQRLDEFRRTLDRARAERAGVARNDTLISAGWPAEQVAALNERLSEIPRIRRAWLAEKAVKYLPKRHFSVLALERDRWPGFSLRRMAIADEASLALRDFEIGCIVELKRDNAFLLPKLKRLPDAVIFERDAGGSRSNRG